METRTDWRIVAISACAAFVLIGSAYALAAVQKTEPTPIEAPIVVGTPASADDSWKKTLTTVTDKPVGPQGEYLAPKELPPADAIAKEVLVNYIRLKNEGKATPDEMQLQVKNIIQRHVPTFELPTITVEQLTIDQGNDIVSYAGVLTGALSKSSTIKEHELKTFARSIGEKNAGGSPVLARDASIYRGIVSELKVMSVPQNVSKEHLAVLNSSNMLAHMTDLMATWDGDPLTALAYIDQFVETERDVQLSISALYRKLGVLAQKS